MVVKNKVHAKFMVTHLVKKMVRKQKLSMDLIIQHLRFLKRFMMTLISHSVNVVVKLTVHMMKKLKHGKKLIQVRQRNLKKHLLEMFHLTSKKLQNLVKIVIQHVLVLEKL